MYDRGSEVNICCSFGIQLGYSKVQTSIATETAKWRIMRNLALRRVITA